ncbi:MAG: hypothetical protein WD512_04380 [Candidatus Paceibacterota bacterium]
MFYKKVDENWLKGLNINLPNGIVLSPQNKQNIDGWMWYDEPPLDFIMDSHIEGFEQAIVERQTPIEVVDISSLVISTNVVEDRSKKLFSVAIFLDGSYYFIEKLGYDGLLTENEIEENVITFLEGL